MTRSQIQSATRNARELRRLARAALVVGAVALSAGRPIAAQKPAAPVNLKDFDAYVAKAMKDWKVPGMAIAIVKNDSIVFAKGYGVRKLGDPTPVDPQTVFAIGSASKAFTSAAVAMMVDDGRDEVGRPDHDVSAGLPDVRPLRHTRAERA